ncbi:MAG: hypothetical protein CM15mP59_0920 [Flavobacteriaceae bacterium]|nr:MAG: hypothetical protein CM15mP59_0920 [Flavobacteriaceae bacterium]
MEKNYKQIPSNCKKVVLFGPESTGKTTLAKQLAAHFKSDWVLNMHANIFNKSGIRRKKFAPKKTYRIIAAGQMALENQKRVQQIRFLFCDTDLLVTKIYSEVYFDGYCDLTCIILQSITLTICIFC